MTSITRPLVAPPFSATLRTALTLAELLQRVDASSQTVGAAQYRQLVRRLGELLDELGPGDALETLLQTFPAASAVYENRHYDVAGLCRSPLESSLNSELKARSLIEQARKR